MAKGSVTALTILDLSAAFDTIDHTILLDRPNTYCVISELGLGWFKSYLLGRTHPIKVGSTISHPVELQFVVPQGSVLGPVLFLSIQTQSAQSYTLTVVLNYHFYDNDTQLYITVSTANFFPSIQTLKNYLNDIQNFLFTYKLKLNPDKTEYILISCKNSHKQVLPLFPINILGNQVSPAQSVKKLRVLFDFNFTLSDHVSQVIKSTRVPARDINKIRSLLDLKTSVPLGNALVSSRLDYYNYLFVSLTDLVLRRLQWVQNSLCRVVTHSSKLPLN